jgi:hypothetical protein
MMYVPPTAPPWSDLNSALESIGAERDWFAEGAIENNPLAVIIGPEKGGTEGRGKGGKSWALMQLAVATVTGGKWLGRFQIKRPGSVVYLDGENGTFDFARRVTRISRGMGHDPKEVLGQIRHLFGAGLRLEKTSELLKAIVTDLDSQPAALIVLDPLRNHLDGDESSNRDMETALSLCDIVASRSPCPLIIAHHLNRSGTYSGSRSLRGRADLLLEGSDEDEPRYKTAGRWLRHSDPIAAGRFRIEVTHTDDLNDTIATTTVACRFEHESSVKRDMSAAAAKVLGVLRRAGCGLTVGATRDETRQNARTAKHALEELQSLGLARLAKGKWTASTPPSETVSEERPSEEKLVTGHATN